MIDVIGNERARTLLAEQIKNQEIVHSYLFVGQEGIGKKKIAHEFAKQILCIQAKKDCHSCESCLKFQSGNHPDYQELSPEGNSLKISQIREMQEDVYQKPIVSTKKVIIIDEAEKLTEEAQNCLLKTLEEPPQYIVMILITSNESLLLTTIKSRCMKISFENLSENAIRNYIQQQHWEEEPSDTFIKLCNGSIGKTEQFKQYFQQYQQAEQWMNCLTDHQESLLNLLKKAEFLYNAKEETSSILEYMLMMIYQEMITKLQQDTTIETKLFTMAEVIQKAMKKLTSNANYEMCLDEMIFHLWEACT